MPSPNPKTAQRSRARMDRWARRAVQWGFLLLFLYPLFPVLYQRLSFQPAPTFTSWLLPWDPLLFTGLSLQLKWGVLVLGAPLLLIALTLVFGRFFCGWICPVGTLLDLLRPLAFWQKRRNASSLRSMLAHRNSHARFYLLVALVAAAIFSIKWLGIFDPLVLFHRLGTSLSLDLLSLEQPALRVWLALISLLFLAIVALEFWQPRFWCRNLCPLGALLSLFSRFSLLNRKVSQSCTYCSACRRTCPMNAIPKEAHNTHYADCTFCLECETACPTQGIRFGLGPLALKAWKRKPEAAPEAEAAPAGPRHPGSYVEGRPMPFALTRRRFVGGLLSGAAGLAVTPVSALAPKSPILRPPGALPEDEFIKTCILCQECVRVCPTGGLRPSFLEGGLEGLGTPRLVPRAGGCALNPSCPNLCAQVCPVGALKPTRPEELKLGVAEVDRSLCLAWDQGVKCLVCVEACLSNAAQSYRGRVTVDPNRCTGCGRCESGCPVVGSAIRVKPL